MSFNHEKLIVYQRTLLFNSKVCLLTAQWESKHAVCDQLLRAAGSMLENIAMASAAFSVMKIRGLDYAIGSGFECAACLDLARTKRLLDTDLVYIEKEALSEIVKMLVGLRKTWARTRNVIREDQVEYKLGLVCENDSEKIEREKILFHHENLDVYRVAIKVAEKLCLSDAVSLLSNTVFRRLDELLTSMVLNIAEGNGRFSDAVQARFLGTSYESAVKLAARLDLCVTQGFLSRNTGLSVP